MTDHTCHEHDCEEPATRRVNCPGEGWVHYCDRHAEKALAIAGSLGFRLGMDDDDL